MPRRAAVPTAGSALYRRVAELERGARELMARYYETALTAALDPHGDPPPPGAVLARPEDLEEAAARSRAELEAFEEAVRAGRPVVVAGRTITATLAELGFEPYERFGEPERRPGRWRVHPDGRYEPVPEAAEVAR